MVAPRHHGAGALGSSSSGIVRFLVKLAFLRRRVALATWFPLRISYVHIATRAIARATALLHRKIVSILEYPNVKSHVPRCTRLPLRLAYRSCGSKVIREIIGRKEGGAWERGYIYCTLAYKMCMFPAYNVACMYIAM